MALPAVVRSLTSNQFFWGSVLYFVVAVVVLVDRAKEGLVIGYITHIGCFNWKQFKKHTKHSVRYALFLPAGGTQRRGWMVEKLLSKAHTHF